MQAIIANHLRQYYGIELNQEMASNKSIETELKRAKKAELSRTRVLVLGLSPLSPDADMPGTGDSGKSTFIKQMVIKHAQAGHPFTPDQLQR